MSHRHTKGDVVVDRLHWSDELLTHIGDIDNDHKKLFALANAIFAESTHGKEAVNKAIGDLWAYTKEHFIREEESMERLGYPHSAEHRAEHQDLVAQLDYLTYRLGAEGTESISGGVVDFLASWLNTHIMGSDKRLAGYLRASGRVGL